jgi:peptidoglycan hydrolase-like protein with peptidoglycan-binding domain
LLAHELTHTIQQNPATGAPKTRIQRTLGDGHDLSSPRFAGEIKLEACHDDEARLTKGDAGEPVRKVQQGLMELGYNLGPAGVDGLYGDFTWNAVKKFKSDQGLGWEWMGDVGPGTMGRLDALFPSGIPPTIPPTMKPPGTGFTCPDYIGDSKLEACLNDEDRLRPGDTGPPVKKVQQGLIHDNIFVGFSGPDGIFGEKTAQGVMAFKKKHGLGFEQFPGVGPGTMRKLDDLCGEVVPCPKGESEPENQAVPSTTCPCWKIDIPAETATAARCARLGMLAKCLTGNAANWPCIWPLNMQSPKSGSDEYQNYVWPGDTFDISNLLFTSGAEKTYSYNDPGNENLRAPTEAVPRFNPSPLPAMRRRWGRTSTGVEKFFKSIRWIRIYRHQRERGLV